MPTMTALWFDAVLSVKVVHCIWLRAKPTQRHNNVYEMREISLDDFRTLSAFVAGHLPLTLKNH
ncbi:MAG: hypothetical protein WCF66_08820 [Pseudolabrys sp.]